MKDARNGRCNQYHNNLILKYPYSFLLLSLILISYHPRINAKLGGINYFPVSPAMTNLSKERTMVLGKDIWPCCNLLPLTLATGADVSHPAPGSLLPSVAALVASMDPHASRYMASIRVQASRVEMIEDIANMFDVMTLFSIFGVCC
jgi:eukaryotic translation initiation factor 2C